MNSSVQLGEKTFGPYRVYVLRDVESSVQREQPTADKSAASTLPSGLFEAFEVGASEPDKTPPHTREYPSGHEEKRSQQRSYDLAVPIKEKASIQDITLSQIGYGRLRSN